MELNPAPPAPAPAPGGANDHGSGTMPVPANDPGAAGERELSIAPASFGGPGFVFRGRLALELGLLVMVPDPGVAEVEVEAEAGRRGAVTLELEVDMGGLRSTTPRGVDGDAEGVSVPEAVCEGLAVEEEGPAFVLLLPALEARAALNREVFFFAATGALSSSVGEGTGVGAGDFAKEVDELRTGDGDPISLLAATTGGAVGSNEPAAAATDDAGTG